MYFEAGKLFTECKNNKNKRYDPKKNTFTNQFLIQYDLNLRSCRFMRFSVRATEKKF